MDRFAVGGFTADGIAVAGGAKSKAKALHHHFPGCEKCRRHGMLWMPSSFDKLLSILFAKEDIHEHLDCQKPDPWLW